MDDKDSRDEIEALERLLDAYGADRKRWPAAERLRFAPLVASNAEAQRLMAEAAAFDKLLDMAPCPSAERERAAVDRIVAAAVANPSRVRPASARTPARNQHGWGAAALLAASLALGIFTGWAGFFPGAAQDLVTLAEPDAEADFQQALLGDGDNRFTDEELL